MYGFGNYWYIVAQLLCFRTITVHATFFICTVREALNESFTYIYRTFFNSRVEVTYENKKKCNMEIQGGWGSYLRVYVVARNSSIVRNAYDNSPFWHFLLRATIRYYSLKTLFIEFLRVI